MSETLFNVGDKVLVRKDLSTKGGIYKMHSTKEGYYTNEQMDSYAGKVVTIRSSDSRSYRLEEDHYYWTDEMFEGKIVKVDKVEVGDEVLVVDNLKTVGYHGFTKLELQGTLLKVIEVDSAGDFYAEDDDHYWTIKQIQGKLVTVEELLNEPKFKVGDTIQLRDDVKVKAYDGGMPLVDEMLKYKGKKLTVESVEKWNDVNLYKVEENIYYYTDGMIEKYQPKPTAKYNVGDKVQVRKDLKIGEYDGRVSFRSEMIPYMGKTLTIKGKTDISYKVEETYYNFTDSMLEDVKVKPTGKYKVGDKVKVREDIVVGVYDGLSFVSNMHRYKGEELTILEVNETYMGNIHYKVSETHWSFSDSMLEDVIPPVQEVQNVGHMVYSGLHVERVIYNEPATIMIYKVPEVEFGTSSIKSWSESKRVVAKCMEGDTYDKQKGFEACLLKATIKEANKKLKKL